MTPRPPEPSARLLGSYVISRTADAELLGQTRWVWESEDGRRVATDVDGAMRLRLARDWRRHVAEWGHFVSPCPKRGVSA